MCIRTSLVIGNIKGTFKKRELITLSPHPPNICYCIIFDGPNTEAFLALFFATVYKLTHDFRQYRLVL